MNKNLMKLLDLVLFFTFSASNAMTQDFTATGPTDNVATNIIYPLKAGASIQLQVKLKSNRKDTCTVSIDKNAVGYISDWVTISDNNLKIFPNQEVTFQFTIKPPVGTADSEYPLQLKFDAYDKYKNNHPFSYKELTVIVDNTPPDVPTVIVQDKTSKSISIHFNSSDFRSEHYTENDPTSGIAGIKTYTLTIQNPQGSTTSKTFNATDISSYYTFGGLSPYTPYAIGVTATDLASNSSTSPALYSTTLPGPPTNLRAINTTYFSTTLVWDAAPGASSYEVYSVTSGNTPIGNTSTTAFTISGLSVGSTSRFAVKSVCSEGKSELSGALLVSTPRPSISGSSTLCSEETYSVENFLPGATALWTWSGSLALSSGQGSGSAVFIKSGDGIGLIGATVTFEGQSINLAPLRVSVGAPLRPHINNGSTTSTYSTVNYTLQLGQPTTSLQLFFVDQPNSALSGQWVVQKTSYPDNFTLVQSDNSVFVTPNGTGTGSFTVKGVNLCGESGVTRVNLTITQSGGHGPIDPPELPLDFAISPNPATEQVCITLQNSELLGYSKSSSESSKLEVQLWSATELIKLVKTGESTVQLPLGGLASGTYYIRVIHNGKVKSKVFFKR